MELRELLKDISLQYEDSKSEIFKNHALANKIRTKLPNKLKNFIQNDWSGLIIKGSAGQGQWAEVPWCALFNPIVTEGAEKGYYVVYLFNTKNKTIYLSLNQGTTSVRNEFGEKLYIHTLNQRAALYREKLHKVQRNFPLNTTIKLDGIKARGYAAGHILGFQYDVTDLPNDNILVDNLKITLKAYSDLIFQDNSLYEDDNDKFKEGNNLTIKEQRIYHYHRRIERSSCAKNVKKILGVQCQCCGINFREQYGEIGEGFIEAHHLEPLSSLDPGSSKEYDVKKDFAVLCANCHRMIHRLEDPSNLEQLKLITKFKF